MNILEVLGLGWLIFSSALAHVAILIAAYRQLRRTLDLALRGEIEEKRDVREAARVREAVS